MIGNILKATARKLGLDVRRFAPSSSAAAQLRAMLAWHQVNLVFDVGANVGQFGCELRRHVGYRGRIVSFEPMKAAHDALCRLAARDGAWEVAPRAAIGAAAGTIAINVSSNSVSSSVLPMLELHAKAAPDSRYGNSEQVRLAPLDALSLDYLRDDSVAFLKVDTQGYESEVLNGATRTLARAVGLQLEMSLVPLYQGQALMPGLIERVNSLGFDLWGISPTFAHGDTGRMLQVDATFFRREVVASASV